MKRTFLQATFALSCLVFAPAGLNAYDRHGGHDDNRNHDKNDDHGRGDSHAKTLLEWGAMTGNARPYTGSANAIRGVNGGGLPWVVGAASGELDVNGHLEVSVMGLVIDPADPAAIAAGVADQNPVASFRAVVSCLSKDEGGNASTVNIMTDLFPATLGFSGTGGGTAHIEATVMLPKPCIAPIVFVTSPGGAWFAATGN